MAKFSVASLKSRKILGVPALYLLAILVAVLAFFAFRIKPTETEPIAADEGEGEGEAGALYPAMSRGTVVVAPQGSEDGGALAPTRTNDDWLRDGMAVLAKRGYSPGEAQQALQGYLDGLEISYRHGEMRDAVLSEVGLPPYPPRIGGTAAKPVVPSVNTPKPAPVNTSAVPARASRTYTVKPGDTLSGIARANGVSSWQALYAANRAVVGGNPDLIRPGQVLTLP